MSRPAVEGSVVYEVGLVHVKLGLVDCLIKDRSESPVSSAPRCALTMLGGVNAARV